MAVRHRVNLSAHPAKAGRRCPADLPVRRPLRIEEVTDSVSVAEVAHLPPFEEMEATNGCSK
jgi:hypothetical protein